LVVIVPILKALGIKISCQKGGGHDLSKIDTSDITDCSWGIIWLFDNIASAFEVRDFLACGQRKQMGQNQRTVF
jgi:hypothetical protein